ncbi:MAG: hypothetical protein QOJ13_1280 [Gaiellales bacterium]|nr:hypothetical protein [Gaiellales bacterium]
MDGYALSNLRYTHNAADPHKLDAVRFKIWAVFTCNSNAPQATVHAQDELSVAAQS